VLTADDGRFAFVNLLPGKYRLGAQQRGGRQELYRQMEQYSTAIVAGPGLNTEAIVFPMKAPATLSGVVVDSEGDTVRQAQIYLFLKEVRGGRMQTVRAGNCNTDASGAFHCGHLSAGSYIVAVQARPWYAQPRGFQVLRGPAAGQPAIPPPEPSPEQDVAYPVTYYGDGTDPANAAPVALAEGSSVNIQINLRAVPAAHLTVVGAGSPVTTQMRNTMLEPIGPDGFPLGPVGFGGGGEHQELSGFAPGRYFLDSQLLGNREGPQPGRRAEIEVGASATFNIQDLPETSLSGHIRFEGSPRPEHARLQFACTNSGFQVTVSKEGSFEAPSGGRLGSGRCQISVVSPPGFYIKAAQLHGAKPAIDSIEIVEGRQTEVELVAAAGAQSQLNGVAVKDDQPFAGALVVALPQDAERTGSIRRDQSDSDGSFALPNLPPGRYVVVAIDDGSGLAYQDPTVMKAYLAGASEIDLPAKSDAPLRVKVQARMKEN
jgi:hypothetical protein